MEEWQADVGLLGAALGHNRPESQKAKGDLARKRKQRVKQFVLLGEFRKNEKKQRLMRSDSALAINAKVGSDFQPIIGSI